MTKPIGYLAFALIVALQTITQAAAGTWKGDGFSENCGDTCGDCKKGGFQEIRARGGKFSIWKQEVQVCRGCNCLYSNPRCPKDPQGKPCTDGTFCLKIGSNRWELFWCDSNPPPPRPTPRPPPPTRRPRPPTRRPTPINPPRAPPGGHIP